MHRTALLALLPLLTVTGCVISIGGSRHEPPPVIIPGTPLSPADTATISEIDAAARMSFDNEKAEGLQRIAKRAELSPSTQVHLVNATYRSLSFDAQKLQVLKSLIANPSFSDAARQAMVTQLSKLSFDGERQQILRAIDERLSH